jgi:hypothetical protein
LADEWGNPKQSLITKIQMSKTFGAGHGFELWRRLAEYRGNKELFKIFLDEYLPLL